ncbi:hypothetical protein CBR_g42115 [Chara braunii]|uniref:Uncharacterized protein n=1 Tax=Chara braunii TaxID=69332 RepID=A0A388LX76_CHABU|nr:hypothetical protein CBR_g42115 [Chara braunii]|eukprot:GBG86832.1 hypothetical protein CBR_g42115 [Chara braunii]
MQLRPHYRQTALSFSPRICIVASKVRRPSALFVFRRGAVLAGFISFWRGRRRHATLCSVGGSSSSVRTRPIEVHQSIRKTLLTARQWNYHRRGTLSLSPRIFLATCRFVIVGVVFFSPRSSLVGVAQLLWHTWMPCSSLPLVLRLRERRSRHERSAEGSMKHVCPSRRPWQEAGNSSCRHSGAGKGGGHVPKSKRLRSEEASGGVPLRRGQTWGTADEEDDEDVFTTKEEAAEDTMSAPRGSSLQRATDQSAARKLLTPPPEAQQACAHDTPKAKEVVVDVDGEDNGPLESHRQRNLTQGATTTTLEIRGSTEERPPQGGLFSTPSQSRPRNTAAEGGSVERGGGGGTQQEALVAGGGAIAAAGAGSSGDVAAVARMREELPVVLRKVARGNNRGDRENEDTLLSRMWRGGMAKDLADRAYLSVDDKAFWTTGEEQRLYNIVHETRENFVAIASGQQAPSVPRSVVMPKFATSLTRIADPTQLQQAISRAATVKNIALRVLHGWVFKFGNRL